MERIVLCVLGIAVYFIGGWIAKDIIFSMIEIEPETTLEQIQNYEYLIYSILTGCVLIVIGFIRQEANWSSPLVMVIFVGILIRVIPLTLGSVILYNVLNIAAIIGVAYSKEESTNE